MLLTSSGRRMNRLEVPLVRHLFSGLEPPEAVELLRPGHFVRGNVPFPAADVGELLRLGEAGVGAGELLPGGVPLGEDRAEDEQADREPAGEPLHDLCDFGCASLSDRRGAADRPATREDGDDEAADDRAE